MRCTRCGSEIHHVPEHLRDLAEWVCQECTNVAPRRGTIDVKEQQIRTRSTQRRSKKAA